MDKDRNNDGSFKGLSKDPHDPSANRSTESGLRPQIPDPEFYTRGRFDVIPSNPIKDNYGPGWQPNQADDSEDDEDAPKKKKARHRYNQYESDPNDATEAPRTSKRKSTGDNYRQLYLDVKSSDDLNYQNKLGERKLAALTDEKKREEARAKDEEMQQKSRAQDLQQQIGYWQNQSGQGAYDDSRITNEVEELKRQLGSIPQKFW